MSLKTPTDSPMEPYPHAIKAKHIEDGIVKFPVNVHAIHILRDGGRYITLVAKQNDVCLRFVLNEDDCRHLASLLTPIDTSLR